MERTEQPMFNVAFGVLGPDGPPLTLEALRAHLESRLDQLPSYRWRIVPVPGNVHRPLAVDDPDFDLDAHVTRVHVDQPGDDTAMNSLFAELAEMPMPDDRPLWRVFLVDGLSGGRQAVVLHFHHAIADGSAAMATFKRVFSDAETPAFAGTEPFRPGRLPGRVGLFFAGFFGMLAQLVRIPGLAWRTLRGVRRLRQREASVDVEMPAMSKGAPWTPLNEAFTTRRVFTRVDLPLDALREVKTAARVTVNDVVLGVMSGAVRRLLLAQDALPERPLLAVVPMGDEPADARERQYGNVFWSLTTTLATDIEDPIERLRRIAEVTDEGKVRLQTFDSGIVREWLDVVPPRLLARGAGKVFDRLRESTDDVDASILISNVRGPAQPLTLLGRTVSGLYVCGPPSNGVGLNVSVMSYGGALTVSVLAFADALRDPAAFDLAVEESFAELAEAVGVELADGWASTA
jgi:diacylglycerol O-acyltransferase